MCFALFCEDPHGLIGAGDQLDPSVKDHRRTGTSSRLSRAATVFLQLGPETQPPARINQDSGLVKKRGVSFST